MAGGGFVDGQGGARAEYYEYKITWYFIFASIVAALGGSLFGYDLGVSGGVTSMDHFLKEFFHEVYKRKQEHLKETDYCKYDNQSHFLTLPLASHVPKVASILCLFGAILNAHANHWPMLTWHWHWIWQPSGTFIFVRNGTCKDQRSSKPAFSANNLLGNLHSQFCKQCN
ncbi:unnamed protein product [Lactuca virosa]|uniref:Major facilitator superfamily (MFS) profile domain-containing protein n=1 Tax=Lactuca virosa TaxID=75947 RepID=A0AAU9N5R9_9ASTR|nr:unnamed protein product [Lactuca virosa]